MTDPGETVDLLNLSTVGWHCGNGNQVGIGLEVVGYARYSFAEWTTGDQFAAVRLDAKRAAEVAAAKGIPLRWLSLSQIRNGERGFCTHADISATLGGTNHTDPGPGFPYAIFMQMVQQWTAGATVAGTPSPNPQPGESGGAQPKEWDEMATEQQIKDIVDAGVSKGVARVLAILGDKPPVSQVTGQAMSVVQMLEYVDGHASAIDLNTGPGPSRVDGSPLNAGDAARWADKHASDAAALVQQLVDGLPKAQ
jgi:hypothetical protein